MPPLPDRKPTCAADCSDLLTAMQEWAQSWAGIDADLEVGIELIVPMRDFLLHLHARGLARSTLRRHFHGLWAIGGQIIRDLNDDPRLRRKTAHQLLLDAVADGAAPLLHHADPVQQRSVDSTARRLLRFFSAHTPDAGAPPVAPVRPRRKPLCAPRAVRVKGGRPRPA